MRFRLMWMLLPYALVAGCLALLSATCTILAKGAEQTPTAAAIETVSKTTPKQDWLHVTGGGLYLPDAVADTKAKKTGGTARKTAYYVPLLTPAEADARAAAGGVTRPASAIYVKFSTGEFESRYPDFESSTSIADYVPSDVTGTRSGGFSFSGKFKEYLQSDRGLTPDRVTLIDFENRPMQLGEAIGLTVLAMCVAAASVVWIKNRWTTPTANRAGISTATQAARR